MEDYEKRAGKAQKGGLWISYGANWLDKNNC